MHFAYWVLWFFLYSISLTGKSLNKSLTITYVPFLRAICCFSIRFPKWSNLMSQPVYHSYFLVWIYTLATLQRELSASPLNPKDLTL